MSIVVVGLSIVLTIFSTAVLAYISMATMIGPWIAPTLVLIAGLALRFTRSVSEKRNQALALIQTVGSIGGIVATAVGFTFPMLYFLDRAYFDHLMAHPLLFCLIIGILVLGAGSLGIMLGRALNHRLRVKEDLPFPVSQVIHKTITSQTQGKQSKQLLVGFSISGVICFCRDVLGAAQALHLPGRFITIMPMLWAIGFIAGTGIVFPLLVGMLSKYAVLYPLHNHADYLPFRIFPVLARNQFTMAFCSGIVLAGFLPTIIEYPRQLWRAIKRYSGYSYLSKDGVKEKLLTTPARLLKNLEVIFSLLLTIALFYYLEFPLTSLVVILPLTVIAAYNISYIACKIGLAQIGRFTTLVMVPTMIMFKLSPIHLTILCVFVSCCITTSTDLLFGYKVGELCGISFERIRRYQWLGLVVTACSLGFILWLLFTHLQLGSAELFAQRGKARALLIQSFSFNLTVLGLGIAYGLLLKKLRINPTMVFGGILMPSNLTIGLVVGSLGTFLTKDRREYFPVCSGVFAGESIWLIAGILLRMV